MFESFLRLILPRDLRWVAVLVGDVEDLVERFRDGLTPQELATTCREVVFDLPFNDVSEAELKSMADGLSTAIMLISKTAPKRRSRRGKSS